MRQGSWILVGLLSVPVWAAEPAFDVASVKANTSGDVPWQIRLPAGGRLTATNATLRSLITTAYQIQDFDLDGGPGWVGTDRYDVEAKTSGSPEPPEILRMLQTLLAERFRLVVHVEQRQRPVYTLSVAAGGPKLEAPHNECSARFDAGAPGRPLCNGFHEEPVAGSRVRSVRGTSVTMDRLSFYLARELGRPVVNRTELPGNYDLTLEWTPASLEGGVDIVTAVREFGLRLASERGPAAMTVIDSVERPSAN